MMMKTSAVKKPKITFNLKKGTFKEEEPESKSEYGSEWESESQSQNSVAFSIRQGVDSSR